MDVTRVVRYQGDAARVSALVQMLEQEGVSVKWTPPHEQRGLGADLNEVAVNLVSTGTAVAIGAAVHRFLKRFPKAKVEVEGDDGDVTRTIRFDGGTVPDGELVLMLMEEGVRVESPPREPDAWDIGYSADIQATVSAIVATGSVAAISTAVSRFRKRFPTAKVEVEGDDAGPDDGGFMA
jgi:hypothetical protein